METINVKAYGKINLLLDVLGKRPDGYHEMDMIMQRIDLCDDLILTRKKETNISLTVDKSFLPSNEDNLAVKAARIMFSTYDLPGGLQIDLKKRIPVGAGLGGGSADAAAVMQAMNSLFDLHRPVAELAALSKPLGADVPFCFYKGAARARGIGQDLQFIKGLKATYIVLSKPAISVGTKEIYQALRAEDYHHHPSGQAMEKALGSASFYQVCKALGNVLEKPAFRLYPEIEKTKKLLKSYGAKGVLMTGSGASVFGLYHRKERADAALRKLRRINQQTYLVRPIEGEME